MRMLCKLLEAVILSPLGLGSYLWRQWIDKQG
jgi:hypothetical protein